jgi:hypothetical protein
LAGVVVDERGAIAISVGVAVGSAGQIVTVGTVAAIDLA